MSSRRANGGIYPPTSRARSLEARYVGADGRKHSLYAKTRRRHRNGSGVPSPPLTTDCYRLGLV